MSNKSNVTRNSGMSNPTNPTEHKLYSIKKLVNTYKKLQNRRPPPGQNYTIYAYFLYTEPKDGIHGKQIYLGSYPTKTMALEEVDSIIKSTGHDSIYVTESCWWENIDEEKRPNRTLYLDPETTAKDLENQYRHKILREAEKEEEREFITKELEEQAEKELDSTTMEYYAHNWFNAIKNKSSYEYHKQKMEYYEKMYDQRAAKIKIQHKNQPELEKEWLDVYEKRLKRRGEEDIFIMMREGHRILREEMLG